MTSDKSIKTSALVVGSNGLIGSALLSKLSASGFAAVGTTRRVPAASGTIPLDLSVTPVSWTIPAGISVAYLCAGVTKLDDCRKDPASSARINVDALGTLAERLAAQGTFVVFLSTSQVFSGTESHPSAETSPTPSTEYGRQKAAAEARVLRLGKRAAVVRITKVSETLAPLFTRWEEALRRGEEIRPFSDMSAAPVPLSHVLDVLIRVGEGRLSGITQVSADRDLSYADMAELVAQRVAASAALVRPVRARDSGLDLEAVPAHTALDTSRLRGLGFLVPDPAAGIRAFLELFSKASGPPVQR